MKLNRSSGRQARPRGEVTAALILALGVAAERSRGHRAWIAAIPIVGVNFVAFYGQLSFFQGHRTVQAASIVVIPVAVSVVMALALESIAVYLSWQAHIARKAHDSALRLRLGAYFVALLIGALNYSHFCGRDWKPNAYAVAFALASVISPALWSVHSNRESRDDLKAQGLIEDHAVRLGVTRWAWHLYASVIVMWKATWTGENRPAEAIALYQPRRARKRRESYAQEGDRNGSGVTVAPAAAVKKPPPAPQNREREPRRPVPARAARTAGLAAVSEHERQVMLRLLTRPDGVKLPGRRVLAESDFKGSIRTAERVLAAVRADQNGAGHGDVNGS